MNQLQYFADPMCSWCYGFAPELSSALKALEKSIDFDFRLVMGGLRPYNTETIGRIKDFLKEHWHHVQEKSGQPFNYAILEDTSFVYDTEPPSRAVVVVRKLKPEVELEFFIAVQKLFYFHNKNTNDVEQYKELVLDFGIDWDTFKEEFDSDLMKEMVRSDFVYSASLGIQGFPSLVLKQGEGFFMIAHGFMRADRMVDSIREKLEKNENSTS